MKPYTTCLAMVGPVLLFTAALAEESKQKSELSGKKFALPCVVMAVDYGDGVEKRFTGLPWTKGMTILDALKAAQKHQRGIKYHFRGSKSTALLLRIDDLKNEGGRGKNWIYRVNGKLGNRSFATRTLEPDDTVLWKFGSYQ